VKTSTKKLTASSFILLGFAPVLFTAFFVLKQQQIRHRMKEQLEIQQLHTILLASDEVVWAKEGKEIWLDGKLFDVKSAEQKNGIITFQGLFDEEETALNKRFHDNWNKQSSEQNKKLALLFQTLQTIYFTLSADIPVQTNLHSLFSFSPAPGLPTQVRTILTPPPQA
jgi:hypothetical protein